MLRRLLARTLKEMRIELVLVQSDPPVGEIVPGGVSFFGWMGLVRVLSDALAMKGLDPEEASTAFDECATVDRVYPTATPD